MSRAEELINDSIVTAGRQKRPMFASFDDATRIIKELEERLKDIPCKRYVAADKLCESVAELQMQNEALEERIKELENPWISIEDRLPTIGQNCFTTHSRSGVLNACLYGGNSHRAYFESCETGYELTKDVTHWMPIPLIEEQSK